MMECENLAEVESRNTVAEIRGSELPDEIVLLSGHIDSWDIGQVRKTALKSHVYIKPIVLPRQARDKHRESTQQERCVFL
jgi:hypothetical protein